MSGQLLSVDGHHPQVDPLAWVAPTATLIGRVRLAPGASVWYGCVLRGDGDLISIGRDSNIQDLTVAHVDPERPITVGQRVSVGHRAILHGCTIGDEVLVGMGAIVLNDATVGDGALIAAGALIPEGREIPPRSLVVGSPGRVVRELTDDEHARVVANASTYLRLAATHRAAGPRGG